MSSSPFSSSPSDDSSTEDNGDSLSDAHNFQIESEREEENPPSSSESEQGSFLDVVDENLLDLPQVFHFEGKPKAFGKSKMPPNIAMPKFKACRAKGKGQKCTHELFVDAIKNANNNIDMMHDIVEKKTDFIRSNYDATKEKMTEYEKFSKRQLRQGQKIVQQRNRLHSRIGEKDRALKLADIEIKDEKYTSQRLVQRLEKGNKELELSVEKEKNKAVLLERKLKKTKESRDLWKKKTEELTENIRELKQNTLLKPSASDQLFLDQKRMELKLDYNKKNDRHKQDMKHQEEKRKMNSKMERYSKWAVA